MLVNISKEYEWYKYQHLLICLFIKLSIYVYRLMDEHGAWKVNNKELNNQ